MRTPPRTRTCATLLAVGLALACARRPSTEVVVYTSVDQVHAEPILEEFGRRTGIAVRALYDVEASKTSGLVNRLLAEAPRPQADVFWNGEFSQTLFLKERGILARHGLATERLGAAARASDPEGFWVAVGGRIRVLLVNTSGARVERQPRTIRDLLDARYPAARVAVAHPLFGTSLTQAAALYAGLGPERALQFYRSLRDRGVRVVDGNAVVRDLVASGEAAVGWTDSDDACGAVKAGAPVTVVIPDQDDLGTLVVPATVARIAGGPHPGEASRLIEYLAGADAGRRLAESGFAQVAAGGSFDAKATTSCLPAGGIRTMPVSATEIARQLPRARAELGALFVK
jgi:iron(III) transport system substrate-binding protein